MRSSRSARSSPTATRPRSRPTRATCVTDASVGTEWRFDNDKSIAFFNVTGRHDVRSNDETYYEELAVQYSVTTSNAALN